MLKHCSLRSVFLLLVCALVLPSSPVMAKSREYVRDAVLIKYRKDSSESKRRVARKAAKALRADRISPYAKDLERYRLPANMTVEQAMKILANNPDIEVVEPDWIIRKVETSNDPFYLNNGLWCM
ncbi:MAG: S8 family serine peptidase, partial [Pseudomonadales bacterium]